MANAVMALDVGEKRIGVALAHGSVMIAVPAETIEVDTHEIDRIGAIIDRESVTQIVVGYPRNQSGDATAQTAYAVDFATRLETLNLPVAFQDESLTSVQAEQYLKMQGGSYEKGDIDKVAASIILQDYLEQHNGRV
jgi:putative Holliday junction resolvase